MKHKSILITAILFSIFIPDTFHPEPVFSGSEYIVLEDFQKYGSNPFPDWDYRDPNEYNDAADIYSIVEESGRKFLRASTIKCKNSIQIGKSKIKWDIYSFPFISWDWRIRTLPDGGNENNNRVNDSAASIYVVFQKAKVPFSGWQRQPANWIKYVWSTTLPVGTVVTRQYSKLGVSLYIGKYIVVATGKKDMGKWITFKRNVLDDYKTHFGKNPPGMSIVVGILTDSNDTESISEADYDNIRAYRD